MNNLEKLTFAEGEYDIKEILRYAGCKNSTSEISNLVARAIREVKGIIKYDAIIAIFPLKIEGEKCNLGFAETVSRSLAKNLTGCGSVAVVVATAGLELDRRIARFSRTFPSLSHMLSAIGTERVEYVMDMACSSLREKYSDIAPRFSPGYGDLSLSLQKEIFEALPVFRTLGIALSDELLMSPSKSVSALVGIRA